MNLQFIKYFVALSNTLNFTKASEQMFVVQSTFSAGIKKLEEHLDVKLFERDKRNVTLTKEGQVFLPKALELLRIWNEVEVGFKVKDDAPLNIGFFQNILIDVILNSINTFKINFPFTEVNIIEKSEDNLKQLLINEQIDILFTDQEIEDEKIDFQFITEEKLVFAVYENHHLATKKSISLASLHEEAFIERLNCPLYDDLSDRLSELGVKPNKVFGAQNNGSALTLIASEMGISVMPVPQYKMENIVFIPIEGSEIKRNIYLAWNNQLINRKKGIKSFVESSLK